MPSITIFDQIEDSNMMNKKKYSSSLDKLALISIFVLFLSSSISLAMPQNKTIIPVNIGVVLDDHIHPGAQKIWLSCIKMALLDFYDSNAHYKTRLVLKVRDSKRNVVHAAAAGNYSIFRYICIYISSVFFFFFFPDRGTHLFYMMINE